MSNSLILKEKNPKLVRLGGLGAGWYTRWHGLESHLFKNLFTLSYTAYTCRLIIHRNNRKLFIFNYVIKI